MQRSGGESVEGVSGVRTGGIAWHINMWRICNAERQTAVWGWLGVIERRILGISCTQRPPYTHIYRLTYTHTDLQTYTHTHSHSNLPIATRSTRLRMKAKSSVAQPRYYVLDRRFSRLPLRHVMQPQL